MTSTKSHSGVARVGTTGTLIASKGSQLGEATAQRHGHIHQVPAANRSANRSVDAAEHIARAQALREIGSAVLRYRRCVMGDPVSEHMTGVEALRGMGSAMLRYHKGEGV